MREYHIGAILLDKLRPEKVIAYLENPLISPQETTREGYVPNVVYTCGGALHGDRLILPYALNDQETRVATLDLAELISSMTPLH
jgi:predicted GH43/DUF377 family glycosyl hydrolase